MTYMRAPTTMNTKEITRRLLAYYGPEGCSIGCKTSTISKLCLKGKLRARKINGEWNIKEEAAAKVWPDVFDAAGGREG